MSVGSSAQGERVGLVFRVRPGKADEYARRHKEIWPELRELFHDAGVREFSIFLWGEVVFCYLRAEEFARVVERHIDNPIAARWEEEFADIVEYPSADPETGWPERLREVWSL